MIATRNQHPIRVGLVAGEPIRLAGLTSIFEQPGADGHRPLVPVIGTLEELLNGSIDYLVVDLHATAGSLEGVEHIRRQHPKLKLIVIGPEGDDELVMASIVAGARAYLDTTAGPRTVREALDIVIGGSIWAPRRLLSRLIDRLLTVPDGSLTNAMPHLTAREIQVLDLILLARSNREIALELGIEERTVKAHVGRLMRKTGAENRIALSMRALNGSLSQRPGRMPLARQ